VAGGVDSGRVNMLCAVLTRRAGLRLADHDVYVNVTGGVRVEEPAADLGIALAIASAFRDSAVSGGTACFGEAGLTGELRPVSGADRRAEELTRMGYVSIITPEGLSGGKAEITEARTLSEAIDKALL